MAIVLENSTLLNAYYDQRALSSLPNGYEPYFQFGQVEWGYDFIETVDDSPSVTEIDLDTASIDNVFATTAAAYSYVNGNIVISASLPSGTIADGDSVQFSCIGVKDTNGNLIAVAATQPVWLYSERSLAVEIVINTARTDTTTTTTS